MQVFEARVVRGRLVLDAPSALPDGTVVSLVIAAEDDGELDDEERAALKPVFAQSRADFKAGREVTAEQMIKGRRRVTR